MREKPQNLVHRRISFNTTCPHPHKRIQDVVDGVTLIKPAGGKDPPKKDPTTIKPKDMERANINDSPRPASSEY